MGAQSSQPIIVVSGLPRSGTSMMMQMLAAGGVEVVTDSVRRADDDNVGGYFELEAVKRLGNGDTSWLKESQGKAIKVIYRLLESLPAEFQYRVLFMQRPLNEVIASQRAMLERSGADGANVSADQLENLFARDLRRVQGWLNTAQHMDSLDVRYHAVLADPVVTVQQICRFLDMPLDIDSMVSQVDHRLWHQRV